MKRIILRYISYISNGTTKAHVILLSYFSTQLLVFIFVVMLLQKDNQLQHTNLYKVSGKYPWLGKLIYLEASNKDEKSLT